MTKAEVYKDIFVILLTLAFILSIIKFVYSDPYNIPHQFYGEIKCIDATPAPDGTQLSVKVQGSEIKSTLSSSGTYGYSPPFFIWEANQTSNLDFYVSDIYYKSVVFSPGSTQKLDFTISTCGVPPPSGGGSSGGGGGGGSGGGGSSPTSNQVQQSTPQTPKSIIFSDNSPINPSNLDHNISDLIGPKLSNLLTKSLTPTRSILALDISIIALLILAVMVLVVYTKTRSKPDFMHQA